jgi:hypothetical protein
VKITQLTRHSRLGGCFVLVLIAACRNPNYAHEGLLRGVVSYKFATVSGASYPGEIGISGTSIGKIRVYITTDLPMDIRSKSGSHQSASFASIVAGDSVTAWYDTEGIILDSSPPVYPVVRLEFRR